MYGLIDIGSNTIRLNVYKVYGENFKLLFKNKSYAGLAGYVANGKMTAPGIRKASSVLNDFKGTLNNLEIVDLLTFATASLRNISNSEEAKQEIEYETGLKIEIITGEEEGIFGYSGAAQDVKLTSGVLVDIGGSSTELVKISNSIPASSYSLAIGALNMFLKNVEFILPTVSEQEKISSYARELLIDNCCITQLSSRVICGVGGTMRAVKQINNSIHSHSGSNRNISSEEFDYIFHRLTTDFCFAREVLISVCPERMHTLMPGLCILKAIVDKLDAKMIIVSEYGVREGYFLNKLNKRKGGSDGKK